MVKIKSGGVDLKAEKVKILYYDWKIKINLYQENHSIIIKPSFALCASVVNIF